MVFAAVVAVTMGIGGLFALWAAALHKVFGPKRSQSRRLSPHAMDLLARYDAESVIR